MKVTLVVTIRSFRVQSKGCYFISLQSDRNLYYRFPTHSCFTSKLFTAKIEIMHRIDLNSLPTAGGINPVAATRLHSGSLRVVVSS